MASTGTALVAFSQVKDAHPLPFKSLAVYKATKTQISVDLIEKKMFFHI